MTKVFRAILPTLAVVLILLVTYEGFRSVGLLSVRLTPSSGRTFQALVVLISRFEFLGDIAMTAARATVGVLVGGLVGLPIGLILGLNALARRGALPIVDFLRALPAVALFPAFATLLGLGEPMKLALIALPSGLILAVFAYYACAEVKPALIEYLSVLNTSRCEILRLVYIPSVLSRFPAGLRYSLPLALILSVIVDMFVGSKKGLGVRLIEYQETFQLPMLYATIFVTGVLGVVMNWIADVFARQLEKRGFGQSGRGHL